MEVKSQCAYIEFNLTRKEVDEIMKGVALFIYLGRPLEHSDDE